MIRLGMMALAVIAGTGMGPVRAGVLSDILLAPGTVAQAAPGTVITRYAQDRRLPPPAEGATPEGPGAVPLSGAVVVLSATEGGQGPALAISREEGGAVRPLAAFPAMGPNPVLLYFLEGTVRAMAEATGGSPYYIRNRIREAIAAAGPGTAGTGGQEAVITPFANDPNRARMGAFADLTLRIGFEGPPLRLLHLSADTGTTAAAYHDEMRLIGE